MGGGQDRELEGREKRVEMLVSVATQDAVSDCTVYPESRFPYVQCISRQNNAFQMSHHERLLDGGRGGDDRG